MTGIRSVLIGLNLTDILCMPANLSICVSHWTNTKISRSLQHKKIARWTFSSLEENIVLNKRKPLFLSVLKIFITTGKFINYLPKEGGPFHAFKMILGPVILASSIFIFSSRQPLSAEGCSENSGHCCFLGCRKENKDIFISYRLSPGLFGIGRGRGQNRLACSTTGTFPVDSKAVFL